MHPTARKFFASLANCVRRAWCLGLLWSFGLGLWGVAAAVPTKPNLIVYLADDHGVDFLGCYGNAAIRTPNLDRLATQATRFTRVFAASPTCAPSRAAMYSGLYPARNGLMGNHTACRPEVRTLPHYLQPLGYRSYHSGKWHVNGAPLVLTNGGFLVAADPRVLPLGSLVSIPGYDSGAVVPVLDTGGAIKGNRLDVLYPTHEVAMRWGVQELDVEVWDYADGLPNGFRRVRRPSK